MDIYITTHPFGDFSQEPIKNLKESKNRFFLNPKNRKLTPDEIINFCQDAEIIIAGTENYSAKILEKLKKLKLISRVGIGFDNIDLEYCKKNNITVTYTPNAPTQAVAELTIGVAYNLIRNIHISNSNMKNQVWKRLYGNRIPNLSIGIIGFGRIGSNVSKIFKNLGCKNIFVNDTNKLISYPKYVHLKSKKFIYKSCDLISLHVPLNPNTKNLINKNILSFFKKNAILINTSRGDVVNEKDLYLFLKNHKSFSAGLDVFKKEPYIGKLTTLQNVLLTSHMGSMSYDCRSRMEIEATKDAILFSKNKKPKQILKNNI